MSPKHSLYMQSSMALAVVYPSMAALASPGVARTLYESKALKFTIYIHAEFYGTG